MCPCPLPVGQKGRVLLGVAHVKECFWCAQAQPRQPNPLVLVAMQLREMEAAAARAGAAHRAVDRNPSSKPTAGPGAAGAADLRAADPGPAGVQGVSPGASAGANPGRPGGARLARTATAADVEDLLRRGRGGAAGMVRGGSGTFPGAGGGGGNGGGRTGGSPAGALTRGGSGNLVRGGSGTYPGAAGGGPGGGPAGRPGAPLRSNGSAGSLANLARRCVRQP